MILKKFGSGASRAPLLSFAGDAVLNGDPFRRQETRSKLEVLKRWQKTITAQMIALVLHLVNHG
jgi:hypothetical protein